LEKEFTHVIAENEGILFKVCSMYCKNPIDREDLFQDIVIQIWRALPSFKGECKLQTWIYKIALNTAITSFRKNNTRQQYESIDKKALKLPLEKTSDAQEEKKEILYQAIGQLSEVEKAITMLHLDGYSYKEISEIIGISESNIGFKLHKIKAKLKTIINPAIYGIR
jgi:RNA polymerase sigma-70 factor (ECF subfamily)